MPAAFFGRAATFVGTTTTFVGRMAAPVGGVRRVKPLKDISVTQRGWTLDVFSIVRRLVEARGVHAASSSKSPAMQKRTEVRAPSEFTTVDAYAFARELEKLHPDNPVNNRVTRGRNPPATPSPARPRFAVARRARHLASAVTRRSHPDHHAEMIFTSAYGVKTP